MKISLAGQSYDASVWCPATGRVNDRLAYDTETTVSDDPAVVPDYVIGTACDGRHVYFIRRQDLGAFWQVHADCIVYLHTASFDLEVTTKVFGYDFHSMIETGLVRDVSIYYRLLSCATTGGIPPRFSLDMMSDELLSVELDKDESIRKGFGEFYSKGNVDYRAIPVAYLKYAARDAIATYRLGTLLDPQCRSVHLRYTPLPHNGTTGTNGKTALWGWLGHDIQLRGDIALRQIERRGLHIDAAAVDALNRRLTGESERHHAVLASYGYVPGVAGNQAVFGRVIRQIEQERGVVVPITPKSRKKSQAAGDLAVVADHPFVDAFLRAKEVDKMRKTYVDKLHAPCGIVHPRYTLLVRTGRTSCSSPNIQNQPRAGGIRECFLPAPGHLFIACDYSMLELCTLAQITYGRFGRSTMRELINAGVDLHRRVAAQILGKAESDITKDERQKAKAMNFGIPGGMSAAGLSGYASDAYGVDLSIDEAARWRTGWLSLFPEMQEYLAHGDDREKLGGSLNLDSYPDAYPSFTPTIAGAIVLRIAGGATQTSTGRTFSASELEWAWAQITNSRAAAVKSVGEDIKRRRGSRALQRAMMPRTSAVIPTGRVRADCSYTEEKNGPFQGLAADGAKLALYELLRAEYRVVAFVHDEVLIEIPERDDYGEVAEHISEIMVRAMRLVCPDVTIRTEYAVMRRWRKNAQAALDPQGRLIPYEDMEAEPKKDRMVDEKEDEYAAEFRKSA